MIDFLVVTALEDERKAVLALFSGLQRSDQESGDVLVYYKGRVGSRRPDRSYEVALITLAGMGRVQACSAAAQAIHRWNPATVVLVGIAGGIGPDSGLGDVLISDQVVDYELQKITAEGAKARFVVHAASPRLLNASRALDDAEWVTKVTSQRPTEGTPRRHVGPVATGDKVVALEGFLTDIVTHAWPKLIGVEMEAGGVARAAFDAHSRPEFFMLRGVSDRADHAKDDAWRAYACDVAATFLFALLQSGLINPRAGVMDGEPAQQSSRAGRTGPGSFSGLSNAAGTENAPTEKARVAEAHHDSGPGSARRRLAPWGWVLALFPLTIAGLLVSAPSVPRPSQETSGEVGSAASPRVPAAQARHAASGTSTRIVAAPAFNLTPRDLLKAETMSMYVVMQGHIPPGTIFGIISEGFHFELASIDSHVVLIRNGARVAARMPTSRSERYLLQATWSPTMLQVAVNEAGETCRTPPTIPPYSLVQWAREHDILPVRTYASPLVLYNEVLTALQGLEDKIKAVGMQGSFWDVQQGGGRAPKSELETQAAIHGLLFDIATAKNLQVQLAAPSSSGGSGFFVSGPMHDGRSAGVCVEFRNAHSPDLRSVRLGDLKAQMRLRGTDLGIFCLLNYRCADFDEPKASVEQLRGELIGDGGESGIRARVLVIEVSK